MITPSLTTGWSTLRSIFVHDVAERGERDDHLGRHEARAEPLDDHELEAVLPLVLGDLVAEDLAPGRA